MNVRLRQLEVFLAVARQQGFGRAGDAIGLSQSAVSRSIRELEAELAVRLFDRTTREVALTDIGRRFYLALSRQLEQLDQVLEETRRLAEGEQGTVHVATSPTLSGGLMPAILAACGAQLPSVHLQVHDQVQKLNIDSVRAGEVDFGIVVEADDLDDLDCRPLLTDGFWLLCRNDHRFAAMASVAWRQLHGEKLVLLDYQSGSRSLIDRLLGEYGAHCSVSQQLGHSTSVFRLVAAGVGVTVTPGLALPVPEGSPVRLLPLLPYRQRTIMLIRRKRHGLSPVAERVWQLILAQSAELQKLAPAAPEALTGEAG